MTPTAAERAAFEKNARSDAGAVVQRELANFENKAANRSRRAGGRGDFGDFGGVGGFSGKIGHSANDGGKGGGRTGD